MDRVRKKTREAAVGWVSIGGDNPVAVQTMWPDRIAESGIQQTLRRMELLKQYGCGIIRFSVRNEEDVQLVSRLAESRILPVVADVHYRASLAVQAVQKGVHKVRINPGTIGGAEKTREVIRAAQGEGSAIRLGINSGSLPKQFSSQDAFRNILDAAEAYLELFEKEQFCNLVVSLKSPDPDLTLKINREFSKRYDYPLHIGVTEAGPLIPSSVRSTYALSALLKEGIGDTVRVSMTGSMEEEIITAREILRLFDLVHDAVNIISCPKCGRASFDTHEFLRRWEHALYQLRKPVTVAVMGCPVNGLSEARHADIGITGAGKRIYIFRKGAVIRETDAEHAEEVFLQELEKL